MRTLAKYLRNYKKESILAPFFKFLEVVFDLLVPIVIAQIIDVGIAHNDHGYIVQKFFILILMAAAGLAVSITAQFFAAKASVGFATEVRQAVFDHIQKLSYTELDTLGTDTLITRLTDDVNQVQNGVNMGLRLLLRSPFIVFGAMVMAFTINVRCALIFVVAIPVLFLVVFVIMFLSIPLFKKVQGRLDTVTRLTRENLTGVRVIRAFCREDHAVAEFDESNLALTKLNEFVGKISALLNPATYVLINIATVILIQTAGVQVNLGNMQQGEVVALYNYMAHCGYILICFYTDIGFSYRNRCDNTLLVYFGNACIIRGPYQFPAASLRTECPGQGIGSLINCQSQRFVTQSNALCRCCNSHVAGAFRSIVRSQCNICRTGTHRSYLAGAIYGYYRRVGRFPVQRGRFCAVWRDRVIQCPGTAFR